MTPLSLRRTVSAISLIATLGASAVALAESEYEAWLKENTFDSQAAQKEFQDYLDENDREFVGFLKQQWKKVDLAPPVQRDPTPKPVVLPKAPEPPAPKPIVQKPTPEPTEPKPSQPKVEPPQEEPKTPIVVVKPVPKPVIKTPAPVYVPPRMQTVEVDFMGRSLTLPGAKTTRFRSNLNSKSIAGHWEAMAKLPHDEAVKALKAQQKSLQLNDWGVALLAHEYSKALGLSDTNSLQMQTWFYLVKAGFNARLAYNHSAFLLMASKQPLYGVTYFTLDRQRYYAVSLDGNKVDTGRAYTYSGKHDQARQPIDFAGASLIQPSKQRNHRDLSFKYQGETHVIKLDYDPALVAFSATLPQMDIQYYPQQGLPNTTEAQLLKQLQPLVKGKTEEDAINLLLRFVQTAFAYQTDGQQFNAENYLLPVETIHYPYSDCEDRATLFTWLVKNLLGMDAVLLDYPGHIAAAVAFSSKVNGDQLVYQGKTYTVTDPTYINAKAGMTMPQFKQTQPKVVRF